MLNILIKKKIKIEDKLDLWVKKLNVFIIYHGQGILVFQGK